MKGDVPGSRNEWYTRDQQDQEIKRKRAEVHI